MGREPSTIVPGTARQRLVRSLILGTGCAVLLATSSGDSRLVDNATATAGPDGPLVATVQLSANALAEADGGGQLSFHVFRDGGAALTDAGVGGRGPRASVRGSGVAGTLGGGGTWFDPTALCAAESDCVIVVDLTGLAPGDQVSAYLGLTDSYTGPFLVCPGTNPDPSFPDDAVATITLE